jgi:trimeric autotransporter adhesin
VLNKLTKLCRAWFRSLTVAALIWTLICPPLDAAEHHGTVTFGGLPVPGVTVTAKQGDKTVTTVTDQMGAYSFRDLADGVWSIKVEMQGFAPVERDVAIAPNAPSPEWQLKMLPFEDIKAKPVTVTPPPSPTVKGPGTPKKQPAAPQQQRSFQQADLNTSNPQAANAAQPPAGGAAQGNPETNELSQSAANGLLINGSNNNGASSPFALGPAFGNNRRGFRSLYNGTIGLTFDNSNVDAHPFSVTGQETAKPAYNNMTGFASFGGPLRIPHLIRNGPQFFIAYQWLRNRVDTVSTGLVPTAAERDGDLSAIGGPIIPASQISPVAKALLGFYPLPNFVGAANYNYQVPIVTPTHQDSLQARMNKAVGRRDQFSGVFGLQSTRSDNPNLFGFLDTRSMLGMNLQTNWRHTFGQRMFENLGFQFSRQAAHTDPYFSDRANISQEAGIVGNNQEPVNWGPPSLGFSSGITGLNDGVWSFNRNQTTALTDDVLWNRGRHNISWGGVFRRQEFNSLSQQNPRGGFTFTGATAGFTPLAPGSDLAGFLLGIPDVSSIAYGNADKYFRDSIYEAYLNDDWRLSPGFTLNAGVRWTYSSPITELYGRLVNLSVGPAFSSITPVCATAVAGCTPASQAGYPDSLIHPEKHDFQPRVAFSWRPLPASSMVVRGSYGVYYNTSVYQNIALQMAQQQPLSYSVLQSNCTKLSSPACSLLTPFTMATAFTIPAVNSTGTTFGVDPNFRIGYAQNWQLSVQRDLPGAMVLTVTYLGIKGTRGMQEFLPNSYPLGGTNPCPSCLSGYTYLASNGNSTREAGTVLLRRRLHNGFQASVQYTYAKAIDDAAMGGSPTLSGNPGPAAPIIAQNWLDLSAERALSSFDQRQLATIQIQYTTGMGVGGGALVNGWKGALFKEWTVLSQITAGTGLPLTPTLLNPVPGTGMTGILRPEYTGASIYAAEGGLHLNPEAYTTPPSGEWGNAGRDSITGPAQFSLNASLQRTFRLNDRFNGDLQINATNALNHVTFPSWNTQIGSPLFGLPPSANAMRSVSTTFRVRF